MKLHIGVKLVKAIAMDNGTYNKLQGWKQPEGQDPKTPGYLVEYLDGGHKNHPDFDGYISWCPKDVFERQNRPTEAMSFGMAIEAAKLGYKVARKGWNGKDMWVNFSPGHPSLEEEKIWTDHVKEVAKANGGTVCINPYFNMKTADGKIQPGWLASQTDMLADDWFIVTK